MQNDFECNTSFGKFGIAMTRAGNTFIGIFCKSKHWGNPDHSISGVCGGYKVRGDDWWLPKLIDVIFHPWDRNHCIDTYHWEVEKGYRNSGE